MLKAIIGQYSYFVNTSPGFDKLEFEKWRAIRASVGGVGGVLAWVTC